jgi:hypothetical protein
VVSFTPRSLYSWVRAPGTDCTNGWVGPRAVLDTVAKRKIPSPRRESNPRTPHRPARSPALYRLSYHGSSSVDTGDLNANIFTNIKLHVPSVNTLGDYTQKLLQSAAENIWLLERDVTGTSHVFTHRLILLRRLNQHKLSETCMIQGYKKYIQNFCSKSLGKRIVSEM